MYDIKAARMFVALLVQGLDGGQSAAGLLSSSLQGMTTVTAFNMQDKLAADYKTASEVPAA